MSRDTTWFELYDSMKDNQCQICTLSSKLIDNAMDGFLYESVNDPYLREKIKKAHGLCNFHSKMLIEKGDPLAHALIYSDLLAQAISEIDSRNTNALSTYDKHTDCIFCERVKSSEKIYAKAFLSAYEDKDFATKYSESGMLCLPHIKLMLENSSKTQSIIANNILQVTRQKYSELLNDLNEIRRKNDYRFSNEPLTESERTAWKKAVAVLNTFYVLKKQ